MGQGDVYKFMEKNVGKSFSSDEIARFLGINKQTALSLLNKLSAAGDLGMDLVSPLAQGAPKKMFVYQPQDDDLEEIKREREYLSMKDSVCQNWRLEQQLSVIMIRELKILNKRVKHLEELGGK